MVRGRRPRTVAASKGQLKISSAAIKMKKEEDCKKMPTVRRKVASGQMACDSTIQKITQRTRNLRKSLHKIQKQFDNQAITKFFQRTLKAHSHTRCIDGGVDDVGGGGGGGGGSSSSSSGDSGNDNNSSTSNETDENECDAAFAATEHLNNLCENNNVVVPSTVENGILPNDAPMQIDAQTIPNHQFFDVHANDDDVVMMMSQTVNPADDDDDDDDIERIDQSCNATATVVDDAFAACAPTASAPHSIQSTNIFLQKPVLHLSIDETTLMQTKSIVINKHLDACPNFATSFPAFINTSALNNNNNSTTANKIQQNNKSSEDESSAESMEMQAMHAYGNGTDHRIGGSGNKLKGHKQKCDKQKLRKRRPRKCANKWSDNRQNDAIDSDSNSCDSGVVSDRSFEVSSTDTNKPTTPHRIVVCPSTAVSPTSEESPKFPPPPPSNAVGRLRIGGCAKQPTNVKRTRGKSMQKGQIMNTAKSYFTKLNAVATAQAKLNGGGSDTTTESEDNSKGDDAKSDVDCEMSALNIASNDDDNAHDTVKMMMVLPRPLSRSSTPSQTKSMQMTDFYPVRRRSVRKTKKAVEQEYLRTIEKAIEQQCEDGLVVKLFKDKGRGICAGRPFARGEFVVEYIGDLIEQNEADRREEIYAKDSAFGCYMYYFKHKEQQWCIDATAETGKLGRLVNHSRNGNLITKIVTYKNRPHLVLLAKEDIKEGEELTYDYGDRTRESLVNHPWLAL